jgi:transformation/transcription domain-associated protein
MGSHHRYSDKTILRPLGYTTLSDFVHHARSILNMSQMSKVVGMFSKVLHDSSMTLPMSTQYTAVRTLLSVVDIVFHNKDRNPQIGRDILVRILKTLVEKLASLQDYNAMLRLEKTENDSGAIKKAESINMLASKDYAILQGASADPLEAVRDLKSMVRAIIVGHKTVIWYINSYRSEREKEKIDNLPPPMGANEEVASAMLKITHSESKLIDRYIQLALPSMKILTEQGPSFGTEKNSPSDQYRDALTYFAAAFTTFDGYDLRRTFGPRLELVIDAVVDDPTVMVVPRHLLGANATTSYEFCGLLLNFLVKRIHMLVPSQQEVIYISPCSKDPFGEKVRVKNIVKDSSKACNDEGRCERVASTYLQLFERALKSLSVYPDNEKALRPHLKLIVSTCLGSSMEKSDFKTDNYCMLLRYVFRSISAGKFEESYKELLPLIPTVLNGLYRILQATDDSSHHFTAIELFLTIPARLSSLLPHMNLLLRVIIMALRSSSGDLVNLG